MTQMAKGNKYTIPRRRISNNRSAYTAPGVTPTPPGRNPGTVFVPAGASAVQTYLQPTETNTPAQGSSTPNKGVPKAPIRTILKRSNSPSSKPAETVARGSSGDILLQEIMKEMHTHSLEQNETPPVSPDLSVPLNHDILFHPFESKLWVNFYKAPPLPAQDEKWPDFSIRNNAMLNAPILVRSDMLPDQLFEHMNPKGPTHAPVKVETQAKNAAPVRSFRMQPLVNPLLQKPSRVSPKKSGEVRGSAQAWKPPPAFIPGVPFQAATTDPTSTQETLSTPQLGRDVGNSTAGSIHIADIDPAIWHAKSSTQAAPMEPYSESHSNPPAPKHSRSGVRNRPAATLDVPVPMRGIPSVPMMGPHDQNFQIEPRVSANPNWTSGYYPPLFQQQGVVGTNPEQYLHPANPMGSSANPMGSSPNASRNRSSSNAAPVLLTSTRGVYIRGLPANITRSQLCANIRGGAIERFALLAVDDKLDAAVFFITTEAAKAYKQFTNGVGGIWWNPKDHHNSFPSFTAFIGPECCGYDRLSDSVRKAVDNENATRCVVAFGIPEILSIEGIIQRLQRAIHPHKVEIESFTDTTAVVGPGGPEHKRMTIIRFTSITMALRARRYFKETSMFQGMTVHFAPDECAGSLSELSVKWNKELHTSNLMRPSRRNLHGEFAVGMNELASRMDGAGGRKKRA